MNAKGKTFTALVIIISVVALSGGLYAKKKGADLTLQRTDGQILRGELIAVKESSILVMEAVTLNDLTIDIKDVKLITIHRESKFWRGAGFGFLMGSMGAMLATAFIRADWMMDTPGGVVTYGAIGGAVGAIAGGLIGKGTGVDITIEIEGKSDAEIEEILETLRSKARVPVIK
ncbi:MAG: hypothetical protein GTO17_11025 [Candidatus Aminicenantes bacterium]|nr:hypothetical protein [Candidatus Aminicenantes bacterium]